MSTNYRGNIYLPYGDVLDLAFDFFEDYFNEYPNVPVRLIITDDKRGKEFYNVTGRVSQLVYEETDKCFRHRPNYRVSFYVPSSETKQFISGIFKYKIVIDDEENDFQKTLYEGHTFQIGGVPYDNSY